MYSTITISIIGFSSCINLLVWLAGLTKTILRDYEIMSNSRPTYFEVLSYRSKIGLYVQWCSLPWFQFSRCLERTRCNRLFFYQNIWRNDGCRLLLSSTIKQSCTVRRGTSIWMQAATVHVWPIFWPRQCCTAVDRSLDLHDAMISPRRHGSFSCASRRVVQ